MWCRALSGMECDPRCGQFGRRETNASRTTRRLIRSRFAPWHEDQSLRANNPASCAQTPVGAGVFTAQIFDDQALFLNAYIKGGPVALARELKKFFVGINNALGGNPTGAPFTPEVFKLFDAWNGLRRHGVIAGSRKAIARGEELFNTVKIDITGVGGLNDVLNQQRISGFCGTGHDAPNVGNHSVK